MSDKIVIFKTKEEMIKDLEGSSINVLKLSNEELELFYNNQFYIGFYGKVYKIKED